MVIANILLLSILVPLSDLISSNHIEKGIIYKGDRFEREEFPYVVYVYHKKTTDSWGTGCTGTLVKELYVLSAAHCALNFNASYFRIYRGSRHLMEPYIRVARTYVHKDYPKRPGADLSVLKLEKPFPNFSTFIKIGGTPQEFENNASVKCTNVGFGAIDANGTSGTVGYKMTTLVKSGLEACEGHSRNTMLYWREFLCSSAKSKSMVCPGDSGGPMICNGMLYGVASFIYNYKGVNGSCGGPDMQTVHIFINYYLKWVNAIIDSKPDDDEKKKKKEKEKEEKKKKKKKKKKSSGNLLKPHHTFHKIVAMLLYSVLTIFLY